MEFENHLYMSDKSSGDITSYEERLLMNYNDGFNARLAASNHYNLKLGALEEDLADDFLSEYDENDWEEEESIYSQGEFHNHEGYSGTYLM